MSTATFKDALELVETLSDEERWLLIEIVRRRLLEARRDEISKNVTEAQEEFGRGEVKKGSVDELLRELHE